MMRMDEKLKLYGFNNLTKTLSFNIYDVCYAKGTKEQQEYIQYIDKQYNPERLTKILCDVTETIGAHILNISKQAYDPQGSSVTILVSEEQIDKQDMDASCNMGRYVNGLYGKQGIAGHLDKSHLTVHTYPECHPDHDIITFRADIDVSTCGVISPLKSLDYLIDSFDSDVITLDYRVRGFTRDEKGKKLFIDHDITSIQDYISQETLDKYDAMDMNVFQSNFFHTRMMIKDIHLQNYLFNTDTYELAPKRRLDISNLLRKEMIEIFNGRNIYN